MKILNACLVILILLTIIAVPIIYAQEIEFTEFAIQKKLIGIASISVGDRNSNKIDDLLDEKIAAESDQEADVIIFFKNGYAQGQLQSFQNLGGRIKHTYEFAAKGFSGTIQIKKMQSLLQVLGNDLEIIEEDRPLELFLDKSTRIIRARNVTWDVYGFKGDSNFSIAILDTGIDDSHPDLLGFQDQGWTTSNKLIGWKDTTSDNSLSPIDFNGHGNHVASTATGTGASYGNGSVSNINTTFSFTLPTAGFCYVDKFEVKIPGTIILNGTVSSGRFAIQLRNSSGSLIASDSTSPWLIQHTTSTTGIWQAWGCNPGGAAGRPFSIIEIAPYQVELDGNNLFTGIAPDTKLTGVKIFKNDGTGFVSDMFEAFDWIIANKQTYRIKVASMSAGLADGATDTNLRNAANNVVANGIVFVIAAGNDFPDFKIGDPALASKVITVGATNDDDQVTDYSSNGPSGSDKPDVVAPGGSFNVKTQITAADTNDNDGGVQTFADYKNNDYTNLMGTSMSTPHVSGAAALVIQAMESQGSTWQYTEAEALKVKMILLMTSTETNQAGEANNNPSLDRGGKDLVEGYGRINLDATIEAVTMSHSIGTSQSDSLSKSPTSKNVWARKVSLTSGTNYQFNLTVPSGADFDLYLYNSTPDSTGNPVIVNKSISVGLDADESITYTPSISGEFYIVVKTVSGDGQFALSSTGGKLISITLIGYPVNFGSLDYGTNDNPAQGNNLNQYKIRINPETNINVDVYQQGDDYNITEGSILGIGNTTWNLLNNASTSSQVTKTFSLVSSNVLPNTNISMYYWIDLPTNQKAGDYTTMLFIKAVETGTPP